MIPLSAAGNPAVQSFHSLELIQSKARSFTSLDAKKRRRESPPGASESGSLRKCYGADGVGAAPSIRQPLCGYATIVVALLPPSNFVNVTLTRSPTVTAFFMTAMSVRSKL